MEKYNINLACDPKLICNMLCWNTNTLHMRDPSIIILWSLVCFNNMLTHWHGQELISGWRGHDLCDLYNYIDKHDMTCILGRCQTVVSAVIMTSAMNQSCYFNNTAKKIPL